MKCHSCKMFAFGVFRIHIIIIVRLHSGRIIVMRHSANLWLNRSCNIANSHFLFLWLFNLTQTHVIIWHLCALLHSFAQSKLDFLFENVFRHFHVHSIVHTRTHNTQYGKFIKKIVLVSLVRVLFDCYPFVYFIFVYLRVFTLYRGGLC